MQSFLRWESAVSGDIIFSHRAGKFRGPFWRKRLDSETTSGAEETIGFQDGALPLYFKSSLPMKTEPAS